MADAFLRSARARMSRLGSEKAAVLPVPVLAAALEDERDGLGLNGGRLGVAEMIDGGKDGVGKAEFGKGGHETLFRGSDRDGSGWGS